MFSSNCVRCRAARVGGYDGCSIHNAVRVRYVVPAATTVVVTDTRHHVDVYDYEPLIGVDNQGDPVVNMGCGLGIDMRDGSLEVEVAPGFYMDTDSGGGCDSGSDW